MPKDISEIYEEYKIMPNLAEHMLRVAAVATLICDNFTEPISKEDIISVCLLHDMGNIIKFDLEQTKSILNGNIDLEFWKKVRTEYVQKYGNNEHKATMQIVEELGLGKLNKYIELIDFKKSKMILEDGSWGEKICFYADCRVDPHGIVSYDDRINEGKKRYENRTDVFAVINRDELVECGRQIEKQIFEKCRIKPEDINNEIAAPIISKLRNLVVRSTDSGSW